MINFSNFHWVETSNGKRKTKRRVAEIVKRDQGDNDCTSANQYVTNMLAISIALKLADAARRILLYTKPNDANKGFYALCRGVFPIHELCGAMIAIAFANGCTAMENTSTGYGHTRDGKFSWEKGTIASSDL